jgi:hypothetical protein
MSVMPAEYLILGQVAPTSAGSETTLYTVTAGKSAVTSTLTICNLGSVAAHARVNARPAGASVVVKHRIFHDVEVNPGNTLVLTMGMTLASTDVVSVQSDVANGLSFNLFGTEIP